MSVATGGVWLIAGTPLGEPYPCTCAQRRCNPRWCNCAGRIDLDDVPQGCCAHYNTPAAVAKSWRS